MEVIEIVKEEVKADEVVELSLEMLEHVGGGIFSANL